MISNSVTLSSHSSHVVMLLSLTIDFVTGRHTKEIDQYRYKLTLDQMSKQAHITAIMIFWRIEYSY